MARRHHGKGDPPVEVSLPITPMLDMSFQLLAFFVMTFQSANILEGQIDILLPRVGVAQAKQPDQVNLNSESDPDLAEQAEVTVEVSSKKGDIDGLSIREKTKNTSVSELKGLKPALVKLRAEIGGNLTKIKIQADGHLKYGRLVEVRDACVGAGFQTVECALSSD